MVLAGHWALGSGRWQWAMGIYQPTGDRHAIDPDTWGQDAYCGRSYHGACSHGMSSPDALCHARQPRQESLGDKSAVVPSSAHILIPAQRDSPSPRTTCACQIRIRQCFPIGRLSSRPCFPNNKSGPSSPSSPKAIDT